MFSLADSNFYYLSFFMNTGPVLKFHNVGRHVRLRNLCVFDACVLLWRTYQAVCEETRSGIQAASPRTGRNMPHHDSGEKLGSVNRNTNWPLIEGLVQNYCYYLILYNNSNSFAPSPHIKVLIDLRLTFFQVHDNVIFNLHFFSFFRNKRHNR